MTDNWKAPLPRKGLAGALDRFIGPGATKAELIIQFVIPVLAAVAAMIHALRVAEDWSLLQYAICCLLALDISGGVVTNSTSTAKRWYHRAGQNFRQHFSFVLLHLFHLLIVSWLYLGFDVGWLMIAGLYLLGSSALILTVPQYLQRPVAVTAYAVSLMITIYLLTNPKGLEWFLPLFYLKLLISHLIKEEPYRPQD